jgi:hypothetical protein
MMNDADNTQGQGLTTEQIAAASPGPTREDVLTPTREDVPAAAEDDFPASAEDDFPAAAQDDFPAAAGGHGYDDDNAARLAAGLAAPENTDRGAQASGNGGAQVAGNGGAPAAGSVAADPGARVSLLEDGEQQSITMRWKDIQAEFVDEPTKAIQEADALVAELMQRLASMFASERAELEERWAGGSQVSTEDLRQSLRHYRSFFERLLAA